MLPKPSPRQPYRSDWLSRLKDLAVIALVYLVVAGLAKLALGAGGLCRIDPNTGQVICRPALAIDTRCVQVDDCTAAVINFQGDTRWVLTAEHGGKAVGERYVVHGPDGSQTMGTVVAVGANGADCALLRTEHAAASGFQLASFEPPLGSTVKLLGYSLGGPLTAKQLRPYQYDDARTAEAHGVPVLGDSGGPVLDAFGAVVGVLSGQHGGPAFYTRLGPILAMFAAAGASTAVSQPPPFVPEQPKAPEPPAPQTTAQQAAVSTQEKTDARGWTSAPAPTVVVREVPYLVRPNFYGPAWHSDMGQRMDRAELAIAGVEKQRRADAEDAKGLQAIKLSPPPLPVPPLAQTIPPLTKAVEAAAPVLVEKIARTGYLEILAQILLVAGGSAATLGTGYGAWVLAGKAAIKVAGWVLRKHFAGESTPSPPTTSSEPKLQRYEFDSVLKQSVPVGSVAKPAPVVVQTPPTVTYAPADVRYVSIDTDLHARAHAWASEQTARIYGDRRATAADVQTTHDALIKQYLASRKDLA